MKVEFNADDKLLMLQSFKGTNASDQVAAPCIRGEDFTVSKGILIEGQIDPSVEGASIDVHFKNTKLGSILTDEAGKFVFGPVDDKQGYSVNAEKEDFLFDSVEGSYNFKSQRLSKIEI